MSTATIETHTLTLERRLAASPERIFDTLTTAEGIARWFGPEGSALGRVESDPVPGGTWLVEATSPDGETMVFSGAFIALDRPRRIEMTWLLPVSKAETTVAFTLSPEGEGTHLTLVHSGFPEAGFRDRHEWGWSASLDKMVALFA